MPSCPTRLVPYPPAELALKHEVMTAYGHHCVCPGCGEHDLVKLTLDHIDGGGNQERREWKRRGTSFYREVKRLIEAGQQPTTLQILCLDCNISKGDGAACHIDHGSLMRHDSMELPHKPMPDASNEMPEGNNESAAEDLEAFSTRLPSGVKAELLRKSRARGVAAGVIIAELLQEKLSQPWTRVEEKLDLVLQQLRASSAPSSNGHPVQSQRPPYEDPAQLAAYYTWKRDVWDPQHPDPAFPEVEVKVIDAPKPTRWAWLRGGSSPSMAGPGASS